MSTAPLLDRHVLEGCLALGLCLALLGAAGSIWSVFIWTQTGGVNPEARLRVAIPAVTLLIPGVQCMFSGCFLALLSTQAEALGRRRNRTT